MLKMPVKVSYFQPFKKHSEFYFKTALFYGRAWHQPGLETGEEFFCATKHVILQQEFATETTCVAFNRLI